MIKNTLNSSRQRVLRIFGVSPSASSILKRAGRNISYLAVGNLITQTLAFIAFFYIARTLGPDNYGIYATVGAFVSLFHFILFTGLAKVIVREGCKDLNRFNSVLENTIGLRLTAILASVSVCVLVCWQTGYSTYTKILITIFSISLIDIGMTSFLGTIYQATERMEYMAYFSASNRLIFTILSIGFLYLGYGVLSIVIVNLVARFVILAANFRKSRHLVRFRLNMRLNLDPGNVRPIIVFSLMELVYSLAVKIDLLMISFLSTSRDVGVYGVAEKFMVEGEILRNIIATAWFPIAVKHFRGNSMNGTKLLNCSFGILAAVFFGCYLMSFVVEDVTVFIFGNEYAQSGTILKCLMFATVFNFATIPFTVALQATHSENIALVATIVLVSLNVPLNILFFKLFGLIGIAYSTLTVYCAEYAIISTYTFFRLKRQGYLH